MRELTLGKKKNKNKKNNETNGVQRVERIMMNGKTSIDRKG